MGANETKLKRGSTKVIAIDSKCHDGEDIMRAFGMGRSHKPLQRGRPSSHISISTETQDQREEMISI